MTEVAPDVLLYDCSSLMVYTAQSFRSPFLQFAVISQVLTMWTSLAARFDLEDRFAQPYLLQGIVK